MAAPILPRMAFDPLRAMQEAGFTHAVVLRTRSKVRQGNGESVEVTEDVETRGRLVAPGARDAEIAAARGVRIQWVLQLPRRTAARPGQRAIVTAPASEGGWVRTVDLTGDLSGPGARIKRRMAAVDATIRR